MAEKTDPPRHKDKLSLSPLDFEEALADLLRTQPPKDAEPKSPPKERRPRKVDQQQPCQDDESPKS